MKIRIFAFVMRQILSRCSLFRLDLELVAKDDPDHEGERRMIHDKAVEANQEVRHLLPLCLIEPSKSPWGTGVNMVKKMEDMRFSGDFRQVNDDAVKHKWILPSDQSQSRWNEAMWLTNLDVASVFGKIFVEKKHRPKMASVSIYLHIHLNSIECYLTSAMSRLEFE